MRLNKLNYLTIAIFFLAVTPILSGCKKKSTTVNKTTYTLNAKDVLGVGGTVTFTETNSTTTTIDIALTGATSGIHPAHIHIGSTADTGAIAIALNPVDASGKSTTQVTKLDNGTAITYSDLLNYDGYINIHASDTALGTILAQADIGGNQLTGTKKVYNLATVGSYNVSGTATIEQRKNSNSLLTIAVTGLLQNATYPAGMYLGSVTTVGGGQLKLTLHNVDGNSGKSYTTIRKLDDGTPITYSDFLQYDGYVAILQGSTVVCQGNIGSH